MTAEYLTTLLKNSNTDFSGLFKSPSSNDSNGEEYFHSKTTLFTVENLVGNCIAVDYNGSSKMAKICEATTLLDVNSPGEYDCIFRNSGDDPFDRGEVLCIADSKQYSYFSKISDLSMKAECIATYSTLSPEQKEYVIDASMLTPNDVQNADDISNARHVITNPEALKMMFRLCSHALPMNLRFKCMELIREMETTTGRRSAESAMYLSDVLNAGINCEQSVEYPSFDECVKILQTYHYGDDDLLKQIALQIRLLARSDSHGCVFALLGNPGVGKTTIAKGIAECLKKTFFTIKCSGKNMVDLGGVSRIYEGSRHGAIMQGLSTYGGNSCILLDEFDDITVNDDGNPYNLFDSVWDDRKVFCDNFTDVPISVKNVCWVITCNSIDTVPAAIKTGFRQTYLRS
ncbi:MAG: AAA family ATPase, partial [Acutalibacteraceae bacterium]